jgi:hypothetical protein
MSLQPVLFLSHVPSQPCSSKADSSLGTDAGSLSPSQPLALRCSSSISIEEHLDHRHECAIFAPLLARTPLPLAALLPPAQELLRKGESLLSFPLLAQNSQDLEGQALSHFVGAWLLHMGYGSDKTRNHCLTRVKLLKGAAAVPAFARKYADLGQLGPSREERKQLLLETCRNGWEYFIQEVLRRDQENMHADSNRSSRQSQKKARESRGQEREGLSLEESAEWEKFTSFN